MTTHPVDSRTRQCCGGIGSHLVSCRADYYTSLVGTHQFGVAIDVDSLDACLLVDNVTSYGYRAADDPAAKLRQQAKTLRAAADIYAAYRRQAETANTNGDAVQR